MKKNLEDYLILYEDKFDKKLCKQTIKQIEKDLSFEQHTFFNPITGKSIPESGDKVLDIAWGDIDVTPILNEKVWNIIREYVEGFNFSWYTSWSGFTNAKFNKYKETRLMKEHCDHIHSMFDGERKGIPTLTVLTFLNDNYEGGELVFFQDKKIKPKQGSSLVFPSNFLFPHRVEPVTKGTRYSFVNWVW